jgi:ABC-2 type transport system permease protein
MSNRCAELFQIFKSRCTQIGAVVEADVKKLRHDPNELFVRMFQPVIWLLIFGQAMSNIKGIPTGKLPYLDFIAPGILAQGILLVAIFFGISLIWERDMGILQKILVSPAPRSILVIGRALAAGIRGIPQVFIIYVLALLLGVQVRWNPIAILGVVAMVMVAGALFSTLSLAVAAIVKKRERFLGIGQVLTMPLFFASNALYPVEIMPSWLQTASRFNPLTYQVNALRNFMITNEASWQSLCIDFGFGLIVFALLAAIATKLYPKILY